MSTLFTRRRFLLTALGAGAAAGSVTAYTRWFEPQHLRLSQHTVTTSREPADRPLRLLHLSDLHASREIPLDYVARAIAQGIALKPDVICVTGDFVTRCEEIPAGYADVLRALPAVAPTFATLGNHDGGAWSARYGGASTSAEVRAVLAAAGIPCLHNHAIDLTLHGRRIQLVGLGDLWCNDCLPRSAFAPLLNAERHTRVVLSHNPDSKSALLAHEWDLLLSGHTHGGQIGIPFLARRFAPVRDKRFISGLHRWENRWLHVSKGVGCLFGVRFNCRPEVSLLTLA
jgi:predicted MPP superfamily phosphohydrolase